MSVAGFREGRVLVREPATPIVARQQKSQKPGKGLPPAVRAVLEDNVGELVEVRLRGPGFQS